MLGREGGAWANSYTVLGKLVVLTASKGGTTVTHGTYFRFRQLILAAWQQCHPAVSHINANSHPPLSPLYVPKSKLGSMTSSSQETSVQLEALSGHEADRDKDARDVPEGRTRAKASSENKGDLISYSPGG